LKFWNFEKLDEGSNDGCSNCSNEERLGIICKEEAVEGNDALIVEESKDVVLDVIQLDEWSCINTGEHAKHTCGRSLQLLRRRRDFDRVITGIAEPIKLAYL